jgi:hypothetical protein
MENSNKKTITIGVIALIIIIGLMFFAKQATGGPSKLDGFAQCLKDKGATFYGAFWCPHCQNQKALFGSSKRYLPYVECSTPDSQGQTQICKEMGIKSYPTWVFPDMSTTSGEVALATLAEKTSCVLPQ